MNENVYLLFNIDYAYHPEGRQDTMMAILKNTYHASIKCI